MPTIRERLAGWIARPEMEQFGAALNEMQNAYLQGKWQLPPHLLAEKLATLDSAVLREVIGSVQYDLLAQLGYAADSDLEREYAVNESRRLFRYDVITQWGVWVWRNFGFGENIQITTIDESAQEVFDEFWTAPRNDVVLAADKIHEQSDDTIVDGETFWMQWISELDGEVTIRDIPTDEIKSIIYDPLDRSVPLYYLWERTAQSGDRTGTPEKTYLLDWAALLKEDYEPPADLLPKDAKTGDDLVEKTLVCVIPIKHNIKVRRLNRGWPLMYAGFPWSRAHKKFREDRATVAATIAMWVNKIKGDTGSRGLEAIRNKLASRFPDASSGIGTLAGDVNPPAAAGSTYLENEASELTRMPLTTAAGDAKFDGEALLQMAGLGAGIYSHWMGAGDAYRLATATSMEQPMLREFSRYQLFWASAFRRLAKVVLWAAEEYGGKSFETLEVEVSTDRLVELDLVNFSDSMSKLFRDTLQPYAEIGLIPSETTQSILAETWRTVLQAIGVQDANEIASDEAFGVGEEPEEPEESAALTESHTATLVQRRCPQPDCDGTEALSYPDHGGLLVCNTCGRTFDPEVE